MIETEDSIREFETRTGRTLSPSHKAALRAAAALRKPHTNLSSSGLIEAEPGPAEFKRVAQDAPETQISKTAAPTLPAQPQENTLPKPETITPDPHSDRQAMLKKQSRAAYMRSYRQRPKFCPHCGCILKPA